MGNPVTWFDVNGPAPEKAAEFYSQLFGWEIQEAPGYDYRMIDTHSGTGINGGLARSPEGQPPGSVFHVQGSDVQGLLDKALSLGGDLAMPVSENEMVTYAMFLDPWGNVVGIVKGAETEAGPVSAGDNPPVDWFELACTEPEKAWDFYRELFGWSIHASQGGGPVHGEIDSGSGGARGGIGASPDGRSNVTIYAQVDDLQKYLERSESLGAATVMPATEVGGGTSIAMIQDPQGATFGLYVRKRD
jgi:predicted enzyme related to lactoylglutathione lyase